MNTCLPKIKTYYLHLATSEMWFWSGGKGKLTELLLAVCYGTVLCTIIMVHSGMNSSYRSATGSGFDLAWFNTPNISVSSVFMVLYINFLLHSLLYLLVSWAWWPLTWLANHCPSVLWHCWLGHLTRKLVPERPTGWGKIKYPNTKIAIYIYNARIFLHKIFHIYVLHVFTNQFNFNQLT